MLHYLGIMKVSIEKPESTNSLKSLQSEDHPLYSVK